MRDTYNYNKMGIRLGIEKKEKVIMEATRGRIKSSIMTTYKSCTLKEHISTDGDIILLFLVLKGKIYQMRWYTKSLIPNNYLVKINKSTYMND